MEGEGRLAMRCLPGDIDHYGHMNNARYTMIGDVGRLDLFSRSGIWDLHKSRGWGPMMDGSEIAYLREIRLWKRFDLLTSMDYWTDRHFVVRHRFVIDGDKMATLLLAAVGMYDFRNRRFLAIPEVLDALGLNPVPPREPAPEELRFLESHSALRAFGKKLGG